jgi:hypothetical protein
MATGGCTSGSPGTAEVADGVVEATVPQTRALAIVSGRGAALVDLRFARRARWGHPGLSSDDFETDFYADDG